jgi:quercetin dioxygenase-like cupin family protein
MKAARTKLILVSVIFALSAGCKAQKATSVEPEPTEEHHTHAGGDGHAHAEAAPGKPVLTNLIKERLAENEDLEVIVSTVVVPPHTQLPKHYHPGQEFVYVVEGSITVAIDGAEEATYEGGQAGVVPARVHHRAWTKEKAANLVVFRVHDPNKPVRYLIGPDGKELPAEQ